MSPGHRAARADDAPPPERSDDSQTAEDLRDVVARLRRLVRGLPGAPLSEGGASIRHPGAGMEFHGFADAGPGDDLRRMDPVASARAGRPQVRVHAEDRDAVCWILADASASTDFGGSGRTRRRRLAELAALTALSAPRAGQRAALAVFSDRVETMIPPGAGPGHVERLALAVLGARPRGRGSRLGPTAAAVLARGQARGAVWIFSDFRIDDLAPSLALLRTRFTVRAVSLTEPGEERLPAVRGLELLDAETGRRVRIDAAEPGFAKRFAAAREEQRTSLESLFRKNGVASLRLNASEKSADEFAARLRRRSDFLRAT